MTGPLAMFQGRELPGWALVHQDLDALAIDDVAAAVALACESVRGRIRENQQVCLAVGSRGIDRIDEVVLALVRFVRDCGATPFIVPAMGSHGAATPTGQRDVLASLGITEETAGCEIRSSMETVELTRVAVDVPVHFDGHAFGADAIVLINRVKPHTDFRGPVESGLLKMLAIGLGKQRGADVFHGEGFATFAELIPAVASAILALAPVAFGVALIENAHGRLRRLEVVPAESMLAREPALLEEAERHLARLPLSSIDVLIIDRIGKDISGLGMDSNVVGRYYFGPTGRAPNVQRIIVRGRHRHG